MQKHFIQLHVCKCLGQNYLTHNVVQYASPYERAPDFNCVHPDQMQRSFEIEIFGTLGSYGTRPTASRPVPLSNIWNLAHFEM